MKGTWIAFMLTAGIALPAFGQSVAAVADETEVAASVVIPAQPRGDMKTPTVLPLRNGTAWAAPAWSSYGLSAGRQRLDATATGLPLGGYLVQERQTGHWFASIAGVLVRLTGGHQTVVAQEVRGVDVDVHEATGWAVSREPDDTIRIHPLSWTKGTARVLLKGEYFFAPRFSPDGGTVLVQKSGAKAPSFWLVDVASGKAFEAAEGAWPCYDASGRYIVYAKSTNDGYKFTSSDLYLYEVATGRTTALPATELVAETQLSLSQDGHLLAYIDAFTGAIHVVDFNRLVKGGR